jgi:hypothetical protein
MRSLVVTVRVALVAALFFCAQLFAAEYYVKNGGNDANSGLSDAQAWATVAHAAANINPGDTVNFHRGHTFTINAGIDWVDNNILLRQYGGLTTDAKPVMDQNYYGKPAQGPSTGGYDGIFDLSANNITMEDIRLIRSGGVGTRQDGSYTGARLYRIEVYDTYRHGVHFQNGVSDFHVIDSLIEKLNEGYGNNGENTWGGALTATRRSISFPGATDFVFRGNTIRRNYGECIIMFGDANNGLVEDNDISECRAAFVYCDGCNNVEVRNNILKGSDNSQYFRSVDGESTHNGAGIWIATEGKIDSNTGEVINTNWNSATTRVHHVNAHHNVVIGTQACFNVGKANVAGSLDFDNITFAHNTCIDNKYGFKRVGPPNLAGANIAVRDNVVLSLEPGTSDRGAGSFGNFNDYDWNFSFTYWSQGQPSNTNMRGTGDVYGGTPTIAKISNWRSDLRVDYTAYGRDDARPVVGSVLLGASSGTDDSFLGALGLDAGPSIPLWSNKSLAATGTPGQLAISADTNMPGVGQWYSVCDRGSKPNDAQIVVGHGSDGLPADWSSGAMAVGSNPQTVTATGLANEQHECWVYQVVPE